MINTIVEIEHIEDFGEQGFYSKSYLALDKRLNRQVAVKDIIYENLKSEADFEKYFEEAYKLSLATHPRVLPVYYVGMNHADSERKIPRIVTCFFKKGSLNSYLQKKYSENRTLALDEIIRYAHDIIQGMNHLHALDIVHLDLKASNIYIGDDSKMVLGDFGQARFLKDGVVLDFKDLYPAIAPLEASAKKVVDKTADIFQFGLLLYSMLCYSTYRNALDNIYKIGTSQLKLIYRERPANVEDLRKEFKENMKLYLSAIKSSSFPDRGSYPYYVPKKIQEIIHKCLQQHVEDRYNNFYQIQKDLNDYIFPDGVSELYQDLTTNYIHFTKEEKPCMLSIEPNGAKFVVSGTKNGRNVSGCYDNNVSVAKLSNVLHKFASDI
jgi:eukaryotic-like serine/threonine-protein kinase